MMKLRITEYFDSLRNELDVFAETKISDDLRQEDFWNKRRDIQLQRISMIEKAALERANKKMRIYDEKGCADHEETNLMIEAMSKIDSEFCFLFNFDNMMFLLTSKRYVLPNERLLLYNILSLPNSPSALFGSVPNGELENTSMISFTSSALNNIVDKLESNCEIVDISLWIEKEVQIERVQFYFDCYFIPMYPTLARIENLVFESFSTERCHIHTMLQNLDKLKSLELNAGPTFFGLDSILDFPSLERLKIKRLGYELTNKNKPKVRFNTPKLNYFDVENFEMAHLEDHKFITSVDSLSYLKVDLILNPFLNNLIGKLKLIERLNGDLFKGMYNLKEIYINNKTTLIIEKHTFYSFNNLEKLTVKYDGYDRQSSILTIESGAFDGANKLTELNIEDYTSVTIEDGVFSGLINLKKITLNRCMNELDFQVFNGLVSLEKIVYRSKCSNKERIYFDNLGKFITVYGSKNDN